MRTFNDYDYISDNLKMYSCKLALLPSQVFFAKQMEEPFEVIRENGSCTKGKPGDYIVQDFSSKIYVHHPISFHRIFKEFK